MNKTELKEKIQSTFKDNPKLEKLFATEDGQCFVTKHHAINHSRDLGSKRRTVLECTRANLLGHPTAEDVAKANPNLQSTGHNADGKTAEEMEQEAKDAQAAQDKVAAEEQAAKDEAAKEAAAKEAKEKAIAEKAEEDRKQAARRAELLAEAVEAGITEKIAQDEYVDEQLNIEAKLVELKAELKKKTVKELKAMCKKRGFKGYSKLKEDQLISLLS